MAIAYLTTLRFALRKITGANKVSDIDDGIGALADDIDARFVGYSQGTHGERPAAGVPNRIYRETDTGIYFFDTGAAWEPIVTFQPGDLKTSAAAVAPAGWLACEGQAIKRADYPGLFAAIGVAFGEGDKVTTFRVPDFRGRALVGAGAGPGLTPRIRGERVGVEKTNGVVAHTHGVSIPTSGSGTGISVGYTVPSSDLEANFLMGSPAGVGWGFSGPGPAGIIYEALIGYHAHTHTVNDPGHAHAVNGNTQSTGGGELDNTPAACVCNVWIKT